MVLFNNHRLTVISLLILTFIKEKPRSSLDSKTLQYANRFARFCTEINE